MSSTDRNLSRPTTTPHLDKTVGPQKLTESLRGGITRHVTTTPGNPQSTPLPILVHTKTLAGPTMPSTGQVEIIRELNVVSPMYQAASAYSLAPAPLSGAKDAGSCISIFPDIPTLPNKFTRSSKRKSLGLWLRASRCLA
jgi:hypothetical protein